MKSRLLVALLIGVAVMLVVAFSARAFRATAQETPLEPPRGASTLPPPPSYQPLASSAGEPSLPELIANLRELRKQEQLLTKTIKQRILAQKKSLDEAEKELNSLEIETGERPPLSSTGLPFPSKPAAPFLDKGPSSPSLTDK